MSCNGYGAYGKGEKYKGKTFKPKSRCQIPYIGSCGYADGLGVVNDGCNECGGVTPKMVTQALTISLSAPMWDFGSTFVGALLGRQASRRLTGFGLFGSSNITLVSVLNAFQKSLAFIPGGGFSGAFIKLLTCPDSDLGAGDPSPTGTCCSSSSTLSTTTPSSGSCVDCSGRQDVVAQITGIQSGTFLIASAISHGSIIIDPTTGLITLPCRGCYVIRFIVTAASGTIDSVTFSRVGGGSCNVSNTANISKTGTHMVGQVVVNNCCDGCCSVSMTYTGTFSLTTPSFVFMHRYGTC